MITELVNAALSFIGVVSPGSAGYSVPEGILPFGS